MRSIYTALILLASCTSGRDDATNCEADGCTQDSDTGVSTDTSTDTGAVVSRVSTVTVELDVARAPNQNHLVVECDGRKVLDEQQFVSTGTLRWSANTGVGATCEVKLTDAQGGWLSAGRLYSCSKELGAWDTKRGTQLKPASAVMLACVPGCVDPQATNFDAKATLDNGSCAYIEGCTHADALNFDPAATRDDGSCDYGGYSVLTVRVETDGDPKDTTVRVVCNGGVALEVKGLRDAWTVVERTINVDAGYNCTIHELDSTGDGGPKGSVTMCGEPVASWEPLPGLLGPWDVITGSFRTRACSGCTDPSASNYDPNAKTDDGSCTP